MNYHMRAVEAIRMAGQELINRAEEFVPDAERVINTEIVIRIPTNREVVIMPTLEVRTEVAPSRIMLDKIFGTQEASHVCSDEE